MTKNRSPRHPVMALDEAVQRVIQLYGVVNRRPIPQDSAIEVWGLSPKGSTGKRTLAALSHFGLIEYDDGLGSDIVISGMGLDIATDPDTVTQKSLAAIRRAALNPTVYQQVWERWGPQVPTDDRLLSVYLVRELGFNPNSTADFLRDFRATIAFAGLDREADNSHISENDQPAQPTSPAPTPRVETAPERRATTGGGPSREVPVATAGSREATVQNFQLPVGRGGREGIVVLSIPLPLSPASFRQVKAWLDLMEPSLTEPEDDAE